MRAKATVPDIEAWNHGRLIIGESANGHGVSSIEHEQCVIRSLMFAGKSWKNLIN